MTLASLLAGEPGNCETGTIDDRDTGPGGAVGGWIDYSFTSAKVAYTGP